MGSTPWTNFLQAAHLLEVLQVPTEVILLHREAGAMDEWHYLLD
jgi:hypothetical protein